MILKIKPLSVNEAHKGRRFKNEKYKNYERSVLYLLPNKIKLFEKMTFIIQYGFSSKNSDVDNPTKLIVDIMQKKYKFNDNRIYKIIQEKTIVEKGKEFIKIKVQEYE